MTYSITLHLVTDAEKHKLLEKIEDVMQHTKKVKNLVDDAVHKSEGGLFFTPSALIVNELIAVF